ncbi:MULTISPECIES: HAD family hydrolase [unclassified Nocardiopsis]|uniref:HAD family hydrolase n=1 Tax=unclassified Nocardiopsis TaxID=2649073 RepID=UPI0013583BF7|nr:MULTISPECIES: HAD family hydrolase [unclassified Nocardiopsis]
MAQSLAVSTLVFGYDATLTTEPEHLYRPHGGHLRNALAAHGVDLPAHVLADYDQRLVIWQRLAHATALPDLIDLVLTRHGIDCPLPPADLALEVCERAGDAPVTPQAAYTLARLAEQGYQVVVATTTCRPHTQRAKSLADAGLGDLPLVTSTQLGVAAPDPGFYEHVLRRCTTAPSRVVWVGSDPIGDVAGPRAHGIHTLALLPTGAATQRQQAVRCGAHTVLADLAELTDVLVPVARP